jgi:glycosyltransferase involved in cell wall biosynthesis
MQTKKISVVIPVYDEEESIIPLYESLSTVCNKNKYDYELIFVDDASTDNSRRRISEICVKDSKAKFIFLKRNFGQTAALAAGFDHAKGDYIVTLDADLQNDPNDIPLLINKIDEGYDLVNGWRKKREDPFWTVNLPSMAANRLIKRITGVQIHDTGCSLKVFRKELLSDLHLYGEMHRFIPALLHWSGARITEVEVLHHKRRSGKSKYSISKLPRVVLDLINIKFLISYSTRPIQIFGRFAMYSMLSSAISLIILLGMKFFNDTDMTGNPFLLLTVFLAFVSIQFVTMGLLGEINIRIYHETTRNKIYHIAQKT